jgi:uncharacterized protein
MTILLYLLLGLFTGAVSGLIGIGGGVIIVPALVLIFGLTQHQAQGTSLALFSLPIGIFAAMTYYRSGNVDMKIALLLAIGFLIGSLVSSQFAVQIPENVLRKIFGIALLLIAVKMIVTK